MFDIGIVRAAAVIFVVLAALVAAFQVALILGAPWGEFTLGGRWRGSLPPRVRVLPLASTAVLAAFAAVVAARAGIAFPRIQPYSRSLAWVAVAYCVLGTIANAASPSRRERALWLPVVACMLVMGTIVAMARP